MKKIALTLMILLLAGASVFAQSDLQVLAVVKYNKNESITVKQLKTRCEVYKKQLNRALTVEEKKSTLDALINEKLMLQAAQEAGITIPDSYVDQYFSQAMSQSVGRAVTEKELSDYIMKTEGMTLDQLLVKQMGMNVADYKAFLKNQLMMQQYVVQKNSDELQKIAPSDDEIRMFYESNKSSFVWSDIVKVLMVVVEKGSDADQAKLKLGDLLNKYKDKKLTSQQIALQSEAEGSGYQAGEILVPKNESSAAGLGMPFENLLVLFSQDEGFVSDIQETEKDYRFISVLKKYNAKMLALSDIVQPETTVTVYDYIRSNLAQQKQMAYVQTAAQNMSKSLNTSENVEMKKTGAALDKLLDWGE
ncbi:MAG: SurA N-terminal domain-containing protein [Treponema sp.]|nr:SurA N-terminal domain-containing protein [Treponema sp.]